MNKNLTNSNIFQETISMIELEDEIVTCILSAFFPVKFNKNQIIQNPEQIGKHLYFFEKGIARHYYAKENKEFTSWFSTEGNFVANAGFFIQQPVQEIIVALENIEAYAISSNDFEKLCRKSHKLETFVRQFLAEQLFLLEKYFADTFILSATERYQNFISQFPELLLRIPLVYIANFLHMSPETLSRIRARKDIF